MKERSYRWYVEPLDSHTNEVIGRYDRFHDEIFCLFGVICDDGKKHDLWECESRSTLTKIENSKRELNLHFSIWVQEGRHGVIRRWTVPVNVHPILKELGKKLQSKNR